jgi:Holliday junction resolvasome RuvABC endonuclease subunit
MIQRRQNERRVLAIDPSTRGFGFAVLEGSLRLIDWGTRSARAKEENKNRQCLEKVEELIDIYAPDVVALEKCDVRSSRRCARVRRLIEAIVRLAAERKIRVRRISRRQVQAAFAESGASTQHEIAAVIARRFPELAPHLPPVRKAWMAEHHAERVFGAVGMAFLSTKRD